MKTWQSRLLASREAIYGVVIWVLLLCPGLLWAREEFRYLRELDRDESWH